MAGLYNLKSGEAESSDVLTTIQVASASGAIAIKSSLVVITKGTAAAMTLAVPTTAQNGTIIKIVSTTAAAHTVTATTVGFNAGDAASDVGTFAAAIGNGMTVVAYEGEWYVLANTNVTLA